MFELFSCWRSPCCWRTTCSYIHLEVRRVLTKIKQHQQSKKDSTSKSGIYKVKWQRSTWKNGNNNCMHDKDWRCMSMLERRLTIKDKEVTKGRWRRITTMTKNKRWRNGHSSKITKHEGTKNKDYSSTTQKDKAKEYQKTYLRGASFEWPPLRGRLLALIICMKVMVILMYRYVIKCRRNS